MDRRDASRFWVGAVICWSEMFADVYDSSELKPWIRTFICRILQMNFSNRTMENQFKNDLKEMYRMYGLDEEVEP